MWAGTQTVATKTSLQIKCHNNLLIGPNCPGCTSALPHYVNQKLKPDKSVSYSAMVEYHRSSNVTRKHAVFLPI